MKKTAQAPANIAFIKYWGKKDADLRIPLNDSISMNLSGCFTTTTVEFSSELKEDSIRHSGKSGQKADASRISKRSWTSQDDFSFQEKTRISNHLDLIRKKAGISTKARVVTHNSFPKGTGIASSASGFAALTVAATSALSLTLSEKELTILARLGSGSASRSIPDGFVRWTTGTTSNDSYAYSLYPSSYWALCDILVIVDTNTKETSSTIGMENVSTSPLLSQRLIDVRDRCEGLTQAFANKDFEKLGMVIEEDCLNMHAVMQTQNPALNYLTSVTIKVMEMVKTWRKQGIAVYYTIDAGPNVHLICEENIKEKVLERIKNLNGVEQVIINKVEKGTKLIEEHLF